MDNGTLYFIQMMTRLKLFFWNYIFGKRSLFRRLNIGDWIVIYRYIFYNDIILINYDFNYMFLFIGLCVTLPYLLTYEILVVLIFGAFCQIRPIVSKLNHHQIQALYSSVALSVLDSNLFSIVLHVCNWTDFAKSLMSSVRLGFTYRTPPCFIKAKKSPCYVLRYVNKHSFLLPQVYSLSLIPKTRQTSPFSLRKSKLSM